MPSFLICLISKFRGLGFAYVYGGDSLLLLLLVPLFRVLASGFLISLSSWDSRLWIWCCCWKKVASGEKDPKCGFFWMVLWMDVHKTEPLRNVVLQKTTGERLRLPLAPTERIQKNNATPVASKPWTREVMPRYRSGTPITASPSVPATPPRFPSPTVKRMGLSSPPSLPKRSQSAERKRPITPTDRTSAASSPSRTSRPSTPVHDIVADIRLSSRRLSGGRVLDGLWPSMRSLSASFQAESTSVPLDKKNKPISSANLTADQTSKFSGNVKIDRKRTPSRGKNASEQSENLKPAENLHARVLDQRKLPLPNGKSSAKDMSRSMDLSDRGSRSGTLPTSLRGVSPARRSQISDGQSRGSPKIPNEVPKHSSSDGSGALQCESGSLTSISVNPSERAPSFTHPRRTVPLPPAGLPSASSPTKMSLPSTSSRSMASPSRMRPSTPPNKNSLSSASSRSIVSPFRSRPSTPSSPSKSFLPSTSSGSMISPVLTRPSTPSSSSAAGRTSISSSILSYTVDVRKGKKNVNHIEDSHRLRLLYNRDLQWRFVNARADAAMSIQKFAAEMTCLEDWVLLEREHSSSLLAAADTLKASTLQLPVTGGARADLDALKEAIASSVDIMQAMSSSVHQLLSRTFEIDLMPTRDISTQGGVYSYLVTLLGFVATFTLSGYSYNLLPFLGIFCNFQPFMVFYPFKGISAIFHPLWIFLQVFHLLKGIYLELFLNFPKASVLILDILGHLAFCLSGLQGLEKKSPIKQGADMKVEGTHSVVYELSAVAAQERAMLGECRELLASIAAMQVSEEAVFCTCMCTEEMEYRFGKVNILRKKMSYGLVWDHEIKKKKVAFGES
ncbi:hypothetical protein Taro_022573 [Colocasia esculenta]|uniref:Uncharacterized protein n=1 Tax=Colocasia esculenta TaxID=4460 RepID=A0A843UUT5_COLES|nr:hypothetical protein [Colocasia esculenta]